MVNGESLSAYYRWLIGLVGCENGRFSGANKLLKQLFNIDFCYNILPDRNRVGDGLYLRETWNFETGNNEEIDRPCSVLEVLIGLSKRIAQDVIGDPDGTGLTEKIFWRFAGNLGLCEYLGNRYDKNEVIFLIEKWMERDFDYDGEGSPFPLRFPNEDQRECEIWQQVMNYLAENPDVEEGRI